MWTALGVGIDLVHALAMAVWLGGLPLLFVKRWPRARIVYATYAVTFIVVSQASMIFLDECILTVATRWCWGHDPSHVISNDWFTERLARAVFGMAPSRHVISRLSEVLVLATAAGIIASAAFHSRGHKGPRASHP
jgi:putative copper export protein